MSEDTTLVRMQRALAPFDVYVKNAHAQVEDDFDAKTLTSALGFQIRHDVLGGTLVPDLVEPEEAALRTNALRYIVNTGVRFLDERTKPESEDPVVRAEIAAVWVVEYQILRPDDVDEAGISAFGENNVMYHVWPYWREFIHVTCARLRLPQVVLPMFKITRRAPQTKANSAVATGSR
jgi:hypothetical protein